VPRPRSAQIASFREALPDGGEADGVEVYFSSKTYKKRGEEIPGTDCSGIKQRFPSENARTVRKIFFCIKNFKMAACFFLFLGSAHRLELR
jgi:hypothetical protein